MAEAGGLLSTEFLDIISASICGARSGYTIPLIEQLAFSRKVRWLPSGGCIEADILQHSLTLDEHFRVGVADENADVRRPIAFSSAQALARDTGETAQYHISVLFRVF